MTSTDSTSKASTALRTMFGVLLFSAWGIGTILWVYSAIHALGEGDPGPAIKAACALLLMILLMGMEGLEVAVIDRWRTLYPERDPHDLAAWLASRQLFVALICTTTTILIEPKFIIIPFSSTEITGGFALKAFTIIWLGLTLLWFMQIFPKMMAATNPDRYLTVTQRALFPIVELVRKVGIAVPAEWVAKAVQNRLDWHAEPTLEEAPARHAVSLADAWAALIPERAPATRQHDDDQTARS
jgi:hypothetical protein